tara:strand:+ start:2281 stop:2856 length:576 start_codon:yes stop_codon:yes gene_type:complete
MINDLNLRPWIILTGWMCQQETDYWSKCLVDKISWERPFVNVYGKTYQVPRLTFFLGESGIKYNYSNVMHESHGWPYWFKPLLERVNLESKTSFNGCLLNLYRDGNDRMGWHSDDESELDSLAPIASFSLGASRDFLLKHRKCNSKQSLNLSNGDLLIMQPNCQKYWLHSVPSRKKVKEVRINLTFRRYIS